MAFLAVSVDIFQTLADIHPRVPAVWQGILGDRFEPELAQKAAALLGASLPEGFREAAVEFVPMREFFVRRMETVLKSLEISADPEEAADIFRAEHGRAELYPDARPCLEQVSARMPVFIASDADTEMAGPVLEKLPHGPVFPRSCGLTSRISAGDFSDSSWRKPALPRNVSFTSGTAPQISWEPAALGSRSVCWSGAALGYSPERRSRTSVSAPWRSFPVCW